MLDLATLLTGDPTGPHPSDAGVAGKRTRTERLPASGRATPPGPSPDPSRGPLADPFGVHLGSTAPRAAPADGEVDPAALRADARAIARLLDDAELGATLSLDAAITDQVLAIVRRWHEANQLAELVAALRAQPTRGLIAALLEVETTWTYLVAVLPARGRIRLYDLLADGNLDARDTGRFTDDLRDFWDVQMRQDHRAVRAAYDTLADPDRGVGARASASATVLTTIGRYRELDQRYRMKGTLLSKFLLTIDDTITLPGTLLRPAQQTRLLDDLKRQLGDGARDAYLALLDGSHLELARQDAPELLTAGGFVVEEAVAAMGSVADVLAFVAGADDGVARQVVRLLARTPSQLELLIGFVAEHALAWTELCAYGLSLLPARTIVRILERIDIAQVWDVYLALVTVAATVSFLPQLFAAYWLLPEATRVALFATIGRTGFAPLLEAAREHVVPILRGLLDRHLPVGQGVFLERGLGLSVSAVTASGDSAFSIVRTATDTLEYRERLTLRGGAEQSTGEGRTHGKRAGQGPQRAWSLELAATGSATAQLVSASRYALPFEQDDAFLGFLAALVDLDGAVSVGAFLFDELAAIDPLPYLTQAKLEPKLALEARAEATGGLRQHDGETGDDHHVWDGGDKPEAMGSSSMLTTLLGAEVSATVGALTELGAAFELERIQPRKDDDGPDAPRDFWASVQLGARQVSAATVTVPGLGLLSALLPPGLDAGAAIKLRCRIAGLTERDPRRVGAWQVLLVGTTGDLDVHGASASQVEVALTGTDLPDSVDAFVKMLGPTSIKRRFGIASALGSKLLATIADQRNLTAQLKRRYTYGGAILRGSIDVALGLDEEQTRRLARILTGLIGAAAAVADPVASLRAAFMTFVTTGALPPAMVAAAEDVAELLAAAGPTVTYHVEVGTGVAAGRETGGVGGHGYLDAGWILEDDVTQEVGGLDPADLADLVAGRLTDLGERVTDSLP